MATTTQARLVEEFASMGGRVAITLRTGEYREGYILDISATHFTFGNGGPLAPDEPDKLPVDDLDFSSTQSSRARIRRSRKRNRRRNRSR